MIADPDAVASLFIHALGEQNVLKAKRLEGRNSGYCHDSLRAGVLLRPSDAHELSEVCRIANANRIAIVPHGGLTGLVEGTSSSRGDVIVSFERMDRIHRIDAAQGIAVVDAGVTLEALQHALESHGLEFGVDIPSRGSCTIGGMVSTNAGGIRVLRHGMTRQSILGLEVVLADGRVLDMMSPLLKNNAGYDLKHLFIGSEGTLGLITKVVLRLLPAPKSASCALVACSEPSVIPSLFEKARARFGSDLLSFEVMWPAYYQLTTSQPGFPRRPLDLGFGIYGVIEVTGISRTESEETLLAFMEPAFEEGLISDAVVAQSEADRTAIWRAREDSDAISHNYEDSLSYDVGLELKDIAPFVARLQAAFAQQFPGLEPYLFGHLGDGNMHVMIGLTTDERERRQDYDRVIYDTLSDFAGSTISAEHGIGLEKLAQLHRSISPVATAVMKEVKSALDPSNLLNPGKVLPA